MPGGAIADLKAYPGRTGRVFSHASFRRSNGLTAEQSEKLFGPRTLIEWRSVAQVMGEIEAQLAMQTAGIQVLVGHAQERGLVDASGMHLPVEITVEDVRRDRRMPLPRFQSREIVIQ